MFSLHHRDILVFLNDKNILNTPTVITNDHIKSEFSSLRRNNKVIRVGVCRRVEKATFDNTTVQYLSSVNFNEFYKLSVEQNKNSSTNIDETIVDKDLKEFPKKTKPIHESSIKNLIKKRSTSPNRDSGFIETDGTNTSLLTDRSLLSSYNNKRRSKTSLEKSEIESIDTNKSLDSLQNSFSKTSEHSKSKQLSFNNSNQTLEKSNRTQKESVGKTVTDACFVYRRQITKQDINNDDDLSLIMRGREIAHEAANTPTIPSFMPNYTRDEVRELYGNLDRSTRCLKDEVYIQNSSTTSSSNEKPQWKLASPTRSKVSDKCPLPKFRLEKPPSNDEALLLAAYLSTGLTDYRMKSVAPVDNLHTVMMNASAKVNEWANTNDIYLTPIEKNIVQPNFYTTSIVDHQTIDPSSLLMDSCFNMKKLAGTPTNNNDRPTFLQFDEQQTENSSNRNNDTKQSSKSSRKQDQMIDTASSSPDSMDIVLETTPSTPGSCGMYLEPYMRKGYDLPSIDHNVRDSSWQYTDNDDVAESVLSMNNITPVETPTALKYGVSTEMSLKMNDTDSFMDMDDGTTISYHTAKDSRCDHGNRSIISTGSDETTSTLHQNIQKDELSNNITSPEGSLYFDALPSPSQTNQQITSATIERNTPIDNLTNLLEQIETFNRTNRQQISTNIEEDEIILTPKSNETPKEMDKIISVVEDLYLYNEHQKPSIMDNLLFVYNDDNNNEYHEQSNSSLDHLVDVPQPIEQTPTCVDNLIFVYDDAITPSDGEPRPITNDSDEWSYDNPRIEQNDHVEIETDNLGTIIYDALSARHQQPIQSRKIDDLHPSQISSEGFENSFDETINDTDNLGTLIYEVLTAENQKPIKTKSTEQKSVSKEESNIYEPMSETDCEETIVYEIITSERPKSYEDNINDILFTTNHADKRHDSSDESITDIDNLGTIIYEVSSADHQKRIKTKTNDDTQQSTDSLNISENLTKSKTVPDEFLNDTDNLGTIVHECLSARSQQPIKLKVPYEFQRSKQESTSNTDNLEMIVYEIMFDAYPKTIKYDNDDDVFNSPDNLIQNRSATEFNSEFLHEKSHEFNDGSFMDNVLNETLTKLASSESDQRFIPYTLEQPVDDTNVTETIHYEYGPLSERTNLSTTDIDDTHIHNLSEIVRQSLSTDSNYKSYSDENHSESNKYDQPTFDEEIYEEYGYRRITTDPVTNDVIDKFEEFCQSHSSISDQYETTAEQFESEINQCNKEFNQRNLTPMSDTTSEELITTIERLTDNNSSSTRNSNDQKNYPITFNVSRQSDVFGKYGFEFDQDFDGRVKVSSIIDRNCSPTLNIGDEIIRINDYQTFETREQCQLLLDSLWKNVVENVEITVIKSPNIPTIETSEPVSLQSSSLSWPLATTGSGRIMKRNALFFLSFVLSIELLFVSDPWAF